MVDKLGFTRFGRCFCKPWLVAQHIDKRTLAHIASAYKGKLPFVGCRALGHVGVTNNVFSFQNVHNSKCNGQSFSLLIMRVVIQRVSEASVTIDGKVHANIGRGLLVLVGIEDADGQDDIAWISSKMVQLRVFNDEKGVPNISVKDIDGEILLISQFTLHASTKKGNRPSYIRAAKPDIAVPSYEKLIMQIEQDLGKPIATGVFGADMKVALVNDGPITIAIDSKNRE
jgi:D-tyrosyl-tRNA(Tyr) deacylase